MSIAHLGFEVDSKPAEHATVDLDKLVAAADRAESGVSRLGKGSRDLGASMQALVEATRAIARHTEIMSTGFTKGSASAEALSVATDSATAHIRAMDAALGQAASDIPAVAAATGRASAGFEQEAAAIRAATAAIDQHTAAARENAAVRAAGTPVSGFNTANIASQLQDVAVTAAAGQNPLQIALQQGTQLSAVLQQIKSNGQSTGAALAAAFSSVISPVSLITVGLIAGGAAAIQWGISAMNAADDATTALERHSDWLEKTLRGYDAAQDAAQAYLDRAGQLPVDAARIETQSKLTEALKAYDEALVEVERAQTNGLATMSLYTAQAGNITGIASQSAELDRLRDEFIANHLTLNEFITRLTEISHSNAAPEIRRIADSFLELAGNASTALGVVESTHTALLSLANVSDLQFALDRSVGWLTDALETIKRATPELRSQAEIIRDALAEGLANPALTSGARNELEASARAALDALDEIERRREAQKSANRQSPDEKWGTATENFEARLRSMQAEQEAMGMLTFEAERHKSAMDLENQAYQAGIEITPKVHDQILELSGGYAALRLQVEGAQIVLANRSPWDVMSDRIQELDEQLQNGGIHWREYGLEVGKAVEDMVGKYGSAATGILGQAQNLSDALFDIERQRIENSGLAGDALTAAMEKQAKEQFEVNKTLSVANAVVAGGEAIVKSYNWGAFLGGPPGGAIAAAVAAAALDQQIKEIAARQYGDGTSKADPDIRLQQAPPMPRHVSIQPKGPFLSASRELAA